MKTYIVTGASRGIGRETAKWLAEAGHYVMAVSRSKSKLEELSKEVNNGIIKPVAVDLTCDEDILKIIQSLENKGCDGVIHNAGALVNKPFSETTTEDWNHLIQINLMSVVNLTRHLLDHFNKNAHMVMISSMGGFQGSAKFPGLSAYSTVKGALSILTECLSVELGSRDVSANCLCLGAVQTDMLEEAFPGFNAPVQPDEMGAYIGNFVENAHRYMNGKIIPLALNNPG